MLDNGCNYLSMLGLKLNHVSKRGHRRNQWAGVVGGKVRDVWSSEEIDGGSWGQNLRQIFHPWLQGSWCQNGAHLGPTGPRWAPCWPHKPCYLPDSMVHGANMGPIWGRQDPGGPHVGRTNLAISLIAWFMGPTWGPSGADRTQVGPMLAAQTLLSPW